MGNIREFKRKQAPPVPVAVQHVLAASYTAPAPFADLLFQLVIEARAARVVAVNVPAEVFGHPDAAPHIDGDHADAMRWRRRFHEGSL